MSLWPFLLILFFSCSQWQKSEPHALRYALQTKDYDKALTILEESKEYKKKQNHLLYHLEKGSILFEQQRHTASALSFQQAKDTIDDLYTKSLSKKALTFVSNDSADIYYAENYERSLLHLYQAMNFLSLYRQNTQEGRYLLQARAAIVSWNTLDEDLVQKDIMAKLFAALVHEEVDTSADRQIALQLYKDAFSLLEDPYTRYPSFSSKAGHGETLKNYIGNQIARLTKTSAPTNSRK